VLRSMQIGSLDKWRLPLKYMLVVLSALLMLPGLAVIFLGVAIREHGESVLEVLSLSSLNNFTRPYSGIFCLGLGLVLVSTIPLLNLNLGRKSKVVVQLVCNLIILAVSICLFLAGLNNPRPGP
jgi:uncharacterized membrane protein